MNPDSNDALQIFTDRIAELRDSTLDATPRLDASDALECAHEAQQVLGPMLDEDEARPLEAQKLSVGERGRLRVIMGGIDSDALAFMGADVYVTVTPTEPDAEALERAQLAPEVRELDAELKAHLSVHFRKDVEATKTLSVIHRGNGKEDDAKDVLAYAAVAERIPQAERRWSDAWLKAARQKATRQLELLDREPASVQEIRILRRRAWAIFEQNHLALRVAAFFLAGASSAFGLWATADFGSPGLVAPPIQPPPPLPLLPGHAGRFRCRRLMRDPA